MDIGLLAIDHSGHVTGAKTVIDVDHGDIGTAAV
jgi:hypothetical protein